MTQTPAVTSHDFAARLAERLNDVVPAGFEVTTSEAEVVLYHHGQRLGSTSMAELVESSENLEHLPENLETAARAILSNVQDWIADATTSPWPGVVAQPNAEAEVVGDQLRLRYGDARAPTRELRPLTVPVVRETE